MFMDNPDKQRTPSDGNTSHDPWDWWANKKDNHLVFIFYFQGLLGNKSIFIQIDTNVHVNRTRETKML